MAKIVEEVETSKTLNERQKCILNLTKELRERIAALTGSDKTRITLEVEVPEEDFSHWMDEPLQDGRVTVIIKDDTLPF